jgi:exopolysaccharide biosynthesis predicted pyruvyltransferase EpsI
MKRNKIDLTSYFRDLAKSGVVSFYPNPGNAGDSLIACATYQLFKETGVHYRTINRHDLIPSGETIIYGGDSNLVENYTNARNFIGEYHSKVKRLIILPHTISGHHDLISSLGPNVDIITREEVSFEYVKKINNTANVYIAHDVAFNLDVKYWLSQNTLYNFLRMCINPPLSKML